MKSRFVDFLIHHEVFEEFVAEFDAHEDHEGKLLGEYLDNTDHGMYIYEAFNWSKSNGQKWLDLHYAWVDLLSTLDNLSHMVPTRPTA